MTLMVYVRFLLVCMNWAQELNSRTEKEVYDSLCAREPLKPATNDDKKKPDRGADACMKYLKAYMRCIADDSELPDFSWQKSVTPLPDYSPPTLLCLDVENWMAGLYQDEEENNLRVEMKYGKSPGAA